MTPPANRLPGDPAPHPDQDPEAAPGDTAAERIDRYLRHPATVRRQELIRGTNAVGRVPSNKSRVSSKGQVTIPKHVRDRLGLTPGTEVEFELEDGAARIKRRIHSEAGILQWVGHFQKIGTTPEETDSLKLVARLRGRPE